jgi:hypothetical protein
LGDTTEEGRSQALNQNVGSPKHLIWGFNRTQFERLRLEMRLEFLGHVQRSYVSLPLTAPPRTFADVEARDSEERPEPSLPQGNFSYQEREGKSWRCMTCFPLSTRLPNPVLRRAKLLCSSRQILPSPRAESSSDSIYLCSIRGSLYSMCTWPLHLDSPS